MPKTATPKIGLQATSGKRVLRFGLVNVGISMAPALDDSGRISGKMVDPELLTPCKQQYVNENGEIVKPIKAYPYGDRFVTLSADEVPKADGDDVISLVANIDLADLPAEWIQSTYLTWPTDSTQDGGYTLVGTYLRESGRCFIGETVAQGTTKAFALRWSATYGCLVAQLLAFHAQVRWTNVSLVCRAVREMPPPTDQMVEMAEMIFQNLPADFDWEAIQDDYGHRLAAAIESKALSGHVSPSEASTKGVAPPDLLAALQKSVEAAGTKRRAIPDSRIKNGKVTA